jgi:hypothetical protein
VDNPGQTIAATEFAAMAGVSRDRLRTWERRFGFPIPIRVGGGPRRYAAVDVARVIAVRHAAANGTPLAVAIAEVDAAATTTITPEAAFRSTVELAPVPVALIAGPRPLRLTWANAVLRSVPGAPQPGADLAVGDLGDQAVRILQRQFTDDLPAVELHHVAWIGRGAPVARSLVYRLPCGPGEPPLVALVGTETRGERDARRALADAEEELATLRARSARQGRWLEALGEMAAVFQHAADPDVVGAALDVLIAHTRAVDAGLAHYAGGRLILDRTRRRMLPGGALTVAAHPEVRRALRDVTGGWLEPPTLAALGAADEQQAAAVPVVVAGEVIGLVLLLYEQRVPYDAGARRLLAGLSAGLGFAVLRDRLVGELQAAISPRPRPAPPPADASAPGE